MNFLSEMPPKLKWDWMEFCGSENFTIWVDSHQDLSYCFQLLCLQIPVLSIIAVISAYYAGKHAEFFFRTSREKRILKFRMSIVFFLACIPIAQIIMLVYNNSKSLFVIDYGFAVLSSFSWFVHFCYVAALRGGTCLSLRGPVKLLSLWLMLFIACIIHTRSMLLSYLQNATIEAQILFGFAMINTVLQISYGCSLFSGEDSSSRRSTIDALDDEDVLRRTQFNQYVRFREDFDMYYLGTAMEGTGIFSRFFFLWVNSLMEKGAKRLIREPDDVYDLPVDLMNTDPCTINYIHTNISLLRMLHRKFAFKFYGIGILKLISDLAGLASPLLLHELLLFIDDPKISLVMGYLYAGGIFLAAIVASFCTVHFDFFIGKINMQFQSYLISLIYGMILNMDSALLKKINIGEIVNHVSVDMDRIANSCISIHALWSMPFQLVVTLYLLYTQVGLAFLSGVVCTILVLPVNKYIARKIGEFSTQMMEKKDSRVSVMSEFIRGIRQIKLYVWEEYFVSKILGIRAEEVRYLKYRKYLDAFCVYFWATTPVMISTLTFTVYIYMGGKLNAAIVFTSLSLLNMLRMPLNAFPWLLNGVVEAWVSLKRVDAFLQLIRRHKNKCFMDEHEAKELWQQTPNSEDVAVIVAEDYFSSKKATNLSEGSSQRNDAILIRKGQLVGIRGPVGSGKSTLLHAILGEVSRGRKNVFIDDDGKGFGFVSQTPWIQQCSVRDNILFGKPYDADRYRSVMEACALIEDTNLWPRGDGEIVGESGSTLSGGQKARIALARAVYQDAGIYLLDDIFSAVDREVACHIFRECILKLLNGKTRIIVTHLNELFQSFDWVIQLNEGKVVSQVFTVVSSALEKSSEDEDSMKSAQSHNEEIESPSDSLSTNEKEKEVSATGEVKVGIYYKYWKSVGHGLGAVILLSVIGMQISRIAVDWWLSVWVSVKADHEANVTNLYYLTWLEKGFLEDNFYDILDQKRFLFVYMLIGTVNAGIVILRSFSFAYGGVRAAIRIHKELLRTISEASMHFFYISPLGRILNRFSSDTYTVDDELPFDLNILLAQFIGLVGSLITTMYGIPWLCLCIAPLVPVYLWLQNQYRMTSRELKRISSVTRSLLYSHINETVSGLTTIRAFSAEFRFNKENNEKVNSLLECQLSTMAAQAWLNMRLQLMGICIIGAVCTITVLQRNFDVAHAGFIGLALTYALTLTGSLEGVVSIFVETERKMVALERVNEYIQDVETESSGELLDTTLPFAWPSQGVVSFDNVFLKYKEGGVYYALKNVQFETLAGEKVGIVGRTGAGKSSLFSSLFRLTEICGGRIYVDAINIRNVPLKKLRSKMTIIPQDPFIFDGTVRDNLDPLNRCEEFHVWSTINSLALQPLISKLGGINARICDDGVCLSVGEKQLLCLVRAILRNSKIVCIDEATANVDVETDKRIQNVIKSAFKSSTVLMIAHRIKSVMDCDRVLVMGEGEVLEFDSPKSLLQNSDSHFYKLVNQELHS